MNYWLLNASLNNCTEPCDGVCLTGEDGGKNVSICYSNTKFLFCKENFAMLLSFSTLVINIFVYSLTWCFAKSRSSISMTIASMLVNIFSSLLVSSSFCLTTASFGIYWLVILVNMSIVLLIYIIVYSSLICQSKVNACCFSFWDYELINDDSANAYLNKVYDNPPILTLNFAYGVFSKENPTANKYHANIRYGSWELASARITLENRKSTTVIVPKNEYIPTDELDKALKTKIDHTKEILSPYKRISEDPYIKCETFDVDSIGTLYSNSCFFRFLKSTFGKFILVILGLFGFNVILENICWILFDFLYVDNVKRVSKGNDLETPAYVIRGRDSPVSIQTDDKLPSFLNSTQYNQISDNKQGTGASDNNSAIQISSGKAIPSNTNTNGRCTFGQSLIDESYNEDAKNEVVDVSFQPMVPIIPNSMPIKEANDNDNPYYTV